MTGERVDRDLAKKAAQALPDVVQKDERSVLRAVPVMIHTNGLAAAVTYLLARAKGNQDDRNWKVAQSILRDAAETVRLSGAAGKGPLELLNLVIALDDDTYALAQRRAREFAVWLARIGTARCPEKVPAGGSR